MLTVVPDPSDRDVVESAGSPVEALFIDEIVGEGARRILAKALKAEVDAYIVQFPDQGDECERRLVVRNGSHQRREGLTSAGAIEVKAPRVNDRRTDPETGERCRFSSAILPPWCRKTPRITQVLPLLYLHGLSWGDFVPALAFYDYPAEHWVHLRTTNPIESTFATVRHRTKVTKGPGSRAAGLAMAFNLIEVAQARLRAVNAPHLVALVRAGAVFTNGKLVERAQDAAA